MDLVEGEGRDVTPVDYKRGKLPDIPGRVWEPERVQICAQALVLRENGYRCDSGVVYFCGSKTRVEVPITDELLVACDGRLAAALSRHTNAGWISS